MNLLISKFLQDHAATPFRTLTIPKWQFTTTYAPHICADWEICAYEYAGDNGYEGFDTYTSEHLIYSVAGLDFYAETSMDDTCWRYITDADDRCHHASRWFNGMDFKPCLHHFRHWVNASIDYKEDYENYI